MLIFLITALLTCCSADKDPVNDNPAPTPTETGGPAQASDTLTYLALGDSYTIGHSVSEQERWPVQLVDMLNRSDHKAVLEHPDIIAKTGWTTQELRNAVEDQNKSRDYGLVSLLIGVNNQYRGYPLEDYPSEFEMLLNIAIAHAGGDRSRVFVVSIPDYGYTPFGQSSREKITTEIDAYNEINKRITQEKDIKYIYITDISRRGLDDPSLVAEDGLHPSGRQYQLWVQKMLSDSSFFE